MKLQMLSNQVLNKYKENTSIHDSNSGLFFVPSLYDWLFTIVKKFNNIFTVQYANLKFTRLTSS